MSDSLTRRAFLQTTAAVATAAAVAPHLAAQPAPKPTEAWPENGTLIPDEGWTLTLDPDAIWQKDDIYLPEDIGWLQIGGHWELCAKGKPLPTNAPTHGWQMLGKPGPLQKQVLLPTTVEQHFWAAGSGPDSAGEAGTPRPYLPTEYRYAPSSPPVAPADDNVPVNGAYFGISWWSRNIDIPQSYEDKRIFLHIRGARLRAEVFLNGMLVGYSTMEELPFECDLSHAALPGGTNHLDIRITNPFGRFDWVDGSNAKWGKLALYRSHGFGGLDRGMTISAHDGSRIVDAWVLNSPRKLIFDDSSTRVVQVFANVKVEGIAVASSEQKAAATGLSSNLSVSVTDTQGRALDVSQYPVNASIRDGNLLCVQFDLIGPTAEIWSISSPKLYQLHLRWHSTGHADDTRTIRFGFRTFGPAGVGTDAMFRLNGKRIRLYSSISWGFWGLNGLFPVPELAEKEVTQAKKLGLNCLNFHRNLAKEDVLRAHDRLGLLRYLEPGAGKLAVGKLPAGVQTNSASIVMEKPTSEADKFAQRYMFVKCVEMVKAFRSHPSVIQYTLQNEIGADLHNPDTIAVLAAMRAEDPSRSIVLNDGFVAPPRKAAQAWYEPWNDKLHRSDEEEWGGWWIQHQGAGDQWYDEFYKSPTDFTYKSPEHKALSEFGEMEGCATPDNHALMLHQMATAPLAKYAGTGGSRSYDLIDHQQIDDATNAWLTKWGFRKAFPTTEALYNALGKKCYDTWQNYLENARISDDLDFAVISGWESTAIENHSGIVDNLRNFKSDPAPIAQTLQPVHAVAKQHTTVVALGESATFDLYLLNDTGLPLSANFYLSVITPSGKKLDLIHFSSPSNQHPDVFSILAQRDFQTPKLTEEGLYRFKFSVSSAPLATQTKDIWVTASKAGGPSFAPLLGANDGVGAARIAVSGLAPAVRKQLIALGLTLTDFKPGEHYDAIISSGITAKVNGTGTEAGETTGLEALPPTAKLGHKPEPGEEPTTTLTGHLQAGILDAVRAGTPLLCIPQANTLSDGCARQLADAGAFTFAGNVGDFRAPWMGNWYFVREHPLYAGMPVNQAMGMFYQAKGRQSNGLLVDRAPNGPEVEIVVGYSRDHDRKQGAGTFTTSLGKGKIVYHRCPDFHPVLQQRFLANCIRWLTT